MIVVREAASVALLAALLVFAGCGTAEGGASDDLPTHDTGRVTLDDAGDDDLGDAEPSDAGPESAITDAVVKPDTGDETIFPVDDGGCSPSCGTCGADDGCGGKCATGACAVSGEKCVLGKCVAPTRSYVSPGTYAFGTSFARGVTMTLASEGAAKIRYTLDGSAPGPTSASGTSPVNLFVPTTGTTLKWFADNGVAEATTHSFTVNIDSTATTKFGFMIEKVVLNSIGPVIVASPGAMIAGSADFEAWNGTTCPACRMQLIYGIGTSEVDCLYDNSPNTWPGAKATGSIKSLVAPSAPGTYKLNVAYTLQNSCADGLATKPIGVRATMEVGTIVVR